MTRRTVKVAVIGSGLAGLTAAYRLAKTPRVGDVEFEVHVFEKVRFQFQYVHTCNQICGMQQLLVIGRGGISGGIHEIQHVPIVYVYRQGLALASLT